MKQYQPSHLENPDGSKRQMILPGDKMPFKERMRGLLHPKESPFCFLLACIGLIALWAWFSSR